MFKKMVTRTSLFSRDAALSTRHTCYRPVRARPFMHSVCAHGALHRHRVSPTSS